MTDVDPVSRAARALQKLDATQPERAKGTRARIMLSVHARRQKRSRRWLAGLPLGILILGGSAWAQNAGHLASLWENVEELASSLGVSSDPGAHSPKASKPKANTIAASVTSGVEETSGESPRIQLPQDTPSVALVSSALVSSGLVSSAPVSSAPVNPSVAVIQPASKQIVYPSPATARSGATSEHASNKDARPSAASVPSLKSTSGPVAQIVSAAPPPPLPPPPDPELALFRTAHDLHFKSQSAREAAQAYTDYLASYPRGRFVPEARYNRALDLLRLGETAAAQRDLEAFARGDYGSYRRAEASALLQRPSSVNPSATARTP